MSPEPRAQALIEKLLAERGDLFAGLDDLPGMGLRPYYDRAGEPLTFREWACLFEADSLLDGDESYRVVGWTEVGPYFVSTVWLGLDHSLGMHGRPVIFESMVFASEVSHAPRDGLFGGFQYHASFDERRYCTEEEALAGHAQLVEEVRVMWEATRHIDPRLLPPPDDERRD